MHGRRLRVIRKTLSTHRAACMAPASHPLDAKSRSAPRSGKLRSMFSVFECLCRALCAMGLWQRKSAKKFSVFTPDPHSQREGPTAIQEHPRASPGAHGGAHSGGRSALGLRRAPRANLRGRKGLNKRIRNAHAANYPARYRSTYPVSYKVYPRRRIAVWCVPYATALNPTHDPWLALVALCLLVVTKRL